MKEQTSLFSLDRISHKKLSEMPAIFFLMIIMILRTCLYGIIVKYILQMYITLSITIVAKRQRWVATGHPGS